MPDLKQFRLPDVGEGLTEAEIVTWKVKPGDTVRTNDIVVEIETAKSLVELPTPFAGVVAELLVAEGTTVDVGTPIISVDVDPTGAAGGGAPRRRPRAARTVPRSRRARRRVRPRSRTAPEEGAIEPGLIGGPAPGGRTSVLVGYGPRTTSAKRRPRKANVDTFSEEGVKPVRHGGFEVGRMVSQELAEEAELPPVEPHRAPHADLPGHLGHDEAPCVHARALAKPPVRKLAKDLGIDLASVPAIGPGGVVTREDVQAHVSGAPSEPDAVAPAASCAAVSPTGAGRARDAGADQGRAQDDRAGHGRLGVHRAARHRVRDDRRHPHHEARRAAARRPRVPRREGLAAAGRGQGDADRGQAQPGDQRVLGRGGTRRSWSSTT